MEYHSSAGMRGLTATAMPPAQIVPRNAPTQAPPSVSLTATRSPWPIPRERNPAAVRAAASRSSP
jgi:hypothetical protein